MARLGRKPLAPHLLDLVGGAFDKAKDTFDVAYTRYSCRDALMAGLAMLFLKCPSMLAFDCDARGNDRDAKVKHNLERLFKLRRVPCDSSLRHRLDVVELDVMPRAFNALFAWLAKSKRIDAFRWLDQALPITVDGSLTHHAHQLDKDPAKGDTLECATCFKVTHRNGETEFRHTVAVASLVHPAVTETIPIGVEPLTKRDRRAERPTAASDKQDCELAATKRLLDRLFHDHYGSRFIFVGDALYANVPLIRHVEGAGHRYLCRVKASQRKRLFEQVEAAAQTPWHFVSHPAKGVLQWRVRLHCDLRLNRGDDDPVDVVEFEETQRPRQHEAEGTTLHMTWITDVATATDAELLQLAALGRSRWHIENGVFQTLKDQQDSDLSHRYGHGRHNLSAILAMLMILASAIDQIQMRWRPRFQRARARAGALYRLWRWLMEVVQMFAFASWEQFYDLITGEIAAQLAGPPPDT